jgi:MYXO-CTERM domain-containing protein
MRSLLPVSAALSLSLLLAACAPSSSLDGPTGKLISEQARAHGVPAELMAAIAHVEGGLKLAPVREAHPDELVPVAGVLELRHGRFNSLARGAELMGVDEGALVRDLRAGTEAGARVLADLAAQRGIQRGSLAAWAPVVEELSGLSSERDRAEYRAKVFAVLYKGGSLPARGGETLVIAPHDEVPFDLTVPPVEFAPQDTPEYAGAKWFPTPQDNKWTPGRGGNPVTMIAVHDTEGGWAASVATLQNDGGKSVHYIIDADGSQVGQFVHESDTAWHAGNWYYNQHMVGIEHVGYAADDYDPAIYAASAKLVRDIAKRQKLGPNKDGSDLDRKVMVGHQEVPDGNVIPENSPPCADSPGSCTKSDKYGGANNHRDPGVNWEWCQYMEMIGNGAHCKCNDAFDHFNCTYDKSEAWKCPNGKVEVEHCESHSCIVEPNGVDDKCGQVATGSGGSGGQTTTGTTDSGTGGAAGQGGAGVGGGAAGGDLTGGAGGDTGGTGGAGGSKSSRGSSCAVSRQGANGGEGEALWGAAMLALGAAAARRRRSRRGARQD